MPIGNNAEMLLKYDMIMITSVNNSSYTVTGCLQSFTYRKNIFSIPKDDFYLAGSTAIKEVVCKIVCA